MNDFTLPDEILKAYSQDILSTKSLINKDIPHTINLTNVINKLDLSRYDFALITNLLLSIVITPDKYKVQDIETKAILKLVNRLQELYRKEVIKMFNDPPEAAEAHDAYCERYDRLLYTTEVSNTEDFLSSISYKIREIDKSKLDPKSKILLESLNELSRNYAINQIKK